ncbi:bifunctional diaminohydroxyphosphoribosylaminopyrimidine deaminase/5-amino-6-(5-phosphoribosylamino)uracil reductase RibD [Paludifilum halophilum]|uniref:Riboflavin biosynthesis protein RibD n=1 Tax=Paludifilum halophilum TaxID=1642702 RepID=A0A235BCR6_9BACL|nr:bifunctional diaminohydroxyphosphoribosylaminopyrimidine deaminase/5-amino-6-(5-phosphoribosylamino)uracil reductase RibD [Paludifilum halophilum]OYD09767.1 riboflavin biosynthesis protein RibD [Paludifilum halophilum]
MTQHRGTTDEKWMDLALHLAETTRGQTSPNPMVGAVVVKEGRVLGSGAHLRAGAPHAEVYALDLAGEEAQGSTLYVTLEPCNHRGRTPPCTERAIAAGVKRVVIGTLDPDERVSGSGERRLQEAGIEVEEGVLRNRCLELNEAYFHHRRTGRPFVILKSAVTLDGKTATPTGDSRWVTGEAARERVHQMRHWCDAVMIGSGTALRDRPRLTVRLPSGGRNPLRVLLDSRLRLPLDAPLADVGEASTWVFCTDEADGEKERALAAKGVRVIRAGKGPRVDLEAVLNILGQEGVLSVLAECGGELNASLLEEGLVDKVVFFVAPKLLGGKNSPTAVEGTGPDRMSRAVELSRLHVESVGEDWCVTGYPEKTKDLSGN